MFITRVLLLQPVQDLVDVDPAAPDRPCLSLARVGKWYLAHEWKASDPLEAGGNTMGNTCPCTPPTVNYPPVPVSSSVWLVASCISVCLKRHLDASQINKLSCFMVAILRLLCNGGGGNNQHADCSQQKTKTTMVSEKAGKVL